MKLFETESILVCQNKISYENNIANIRVEFIMCAYIFTSYKALGTEKKERKI